MDQIHKAMQKARGFHSIDGICVSGCPMIEKHQQSTLNVPAKIGINHNALTR